ncbi:MAG: efflux RND transporter permease subunit [Pseudomonadota bacterium]
MRAPVSGAGIFGYFVRHATAANLLLALMILAGLAALQGLRTQLWPDLSINAVSVSVTWRGASPEQMDRAVVAPLYPALREVEGVTRIASTAREGRAWMRLEFEPGRDMTAATEAVGTAVNGVTGLPAGAEPPVIRRVAWRQRVTDVAVYGPVGHAQIARLADELAQRLRAEGLSRVSVQGAPPPLIRVSAPERALIRHDLSLQEIAAAVADATQSDPGGKSAGARVSTGAERRAPEELGDAVIRGGAEGEKLRLRDVARVEDAGALEGVRYYAEGHPAARVRVERGAQGDAVAMLETVRRVVAEFEPGLPEGVEAELVWTLAGMIESRIALLLDNAALGLALVLGVLFLFLSARTALWVAVGIPAALLAGLAGMWAAGMTLNMVSVFALILTLGMVVDDAIVVGEHADTLARRRGLSPAAAAETAARRMAGPVVCSTLTTIIAFAGLTTIGGSYGRMVADIPLAVGLVMLASLAECFLVLPNHMRHAAGAAGRRGWIDAPSRLVNRGFEAARVRAFRPLMARVIRLRYPALGLAVLLLAVSLEMLVTREVPWRFWHAPERNSISGNAAMLAGADREDTREQVAMMERAIREVAADYEAEHGRNPVRIIFSQIGGGAGRGLAVQDSKEPWQLAGVGADLIPADERDYTSYDFLADVQARLERHPMAEIVTFRGGRGGPDGDAISVRLHGAEPRLLKAAAEEIKAALSAYPQVSALEDTLAYDKTELRLELTPLGRALGFTPEALGAELRARLSGIEAAEFPVEGRAGRVMVRLPREEDTADFLHRTRIRTPEGDWVPLRRLVDIAPRPGFSVLRREDGVLSLSVTGDLDMTDADAARAVQERLREEILPSVAARHGLGWELTGLAEDERRFLTEATLGILACLAGIYLVLAWVFASLTRPFAVLLVVPFGLVGAIWGHWWMEVPLSMFSVVGLIGMSGIIVNDSIVLITAIDARARTRAMGPAVLEAVCERLRPVLLTTLTTVLGLAPMLFETSQQAQFLRPTVITLCFGLAFGFVLVLMVTPALVMMQRDAGAALASARRMTRRLMRRARGAAAAK